ncbi:protein GDAP2 homolog [Anneissia japonica]|uniref:protein GDAP2 homolog n=1 Tax=Anneissia japonica TaxID=1529436 RepID=UPI001425AE16|nr:protein GDAP2 homolog [Anneissia japonica]
MDPLGAQMNTVDSSGLEAWSETDVPKYTSTCTGPSRFPCRPDINKKIVLWEGNISQLDTIAIVNSTNETLNDKNPISEEIFAKAGPDLQRELHQQLKGCRTGDAKITKGYHLPARYIIHTVGPRFNIRYKTAAESALYNCYRNVLMISKENHVTSLAMTAIHSLKRGYPPEEGAHIAIRTVRRFLEFHGEEVERIIFVISGMNEDSYVELLPLYFPRNEDEESWACDLLPENVGNEYGEPVIPERKIRIMEKPTRTNVENGDDFEESFDIDIDDMNVGKHAFAAMERDPDSARKLGERSRERSQGVEETAADQRRRYERLLRKARSDDLSELASYRFIYQTGVDIFGRPIVITIGKNFPAGNIDRDKVLLYLIHVLDPIVSKDYIVVYFHTQSTSENQPEMSWLRQVYQLVDSRYRKHLKAFYIVHPTFWSKLVTWYFTTFTASGIKDKIHSLPGVHFLYHNINPDQLDIPPFVLEHDMKINGSNYYQPIEEGESPGGL